MSFDVFISSFMFNIYAGYKIIIFLDHTNFKFGTLQFKEILVESLQSKKKRNLECFLKLISYECKTCTKHFSYQSKKSGAVMRMKVTMTSLNNFPHGDNFFLSLKYLSLLLLEKVIFMCVSLCMYVFSFYFIFSIYFHPLRIFILPYIEQSQT